MIDGNEEDGYELCCDYCGETCDEFFETFQDAVDYKVDRNNKWASVKDKHDEWQEICPSCNTPEIIAEIKGISVSGKPRNDLSATDIALSALGDF